MTLKEISIAFHSKLSALTNFNKSVIFFINMNTSGAMCQCDGNTLTLSVPSYDTVEITYPGDSAEFYGR